MFGEDESSSGMPKDQNQNKQLEEFMEVLSRISIKNGADDSSKLIKIPQFSDGSEWEAVVFELKINLEKHWQHVELDIQEYLEGDDQGCDRKLIEKADKIIYNAIVNASKRESFARKQIMASQHVDAVPRVKMNQGRKLFNLFQSIFLHKGKDTANLPKALSNFNTLKMEKKESAKDFIARADMAVSDLALLNERVSVNLRLFTMANGLRKEFVECKNGILFNKDGFRTILEVKAAILKEETINEIEKTENGNPKSNSDVAHAFFEGNCNYCNKKGHKRNECRKLAKDKENGTIQEDSKAKPGDKFWCDFCYKKGHSTDWCFLNPNNSTPSPKGKGKGGKGKSNSSTKSKGKGKGSGKGNKGKQKGGRGSGNYPANYTQDSANYTEDWPEEFESLQEVEQSSSNAWHEFSHFFFENESSLSITEVYANVGTTWTINNLWSELDFKLSTWEDHPSCEVATAGPECDFALTLFNYDKQNVQLQLKAKLKELTDNKANGKEGLWMYLDSGASRSVIQEHSPIREHLRNIAPAYGSCSAANGKNLSYLERGLITENNEITVVKDLKYDLYAAVSAAKRGVSCVLDFTEKGENQSYLYCKKTGTVTPLIERKQGILEVPVHLYVNKTDKGLMAAEKQLKTTTKRISTEKTEKSASLKKGMKGNSPIGSKLSMATISKFWHGIDQGHFDPHIRENNTDEISLFTFDIINSLGQRQKDFLIHARLAHLPRKAIIQMIKNGSKGLPYSGKFMELCRPCLESRQRAENHGKSVERHPDGKIGEHLHSDLAVVNKQDSNGFKYVLTVVDEISDEVIVTLLKTKTAANVLKACKETLKIITARNKRPLKTWQFDRGSEFMNQLFDDWITKELGAKQMFSNIEHPWENGRAERSFGTLFSKARSMLKHADLPDYLWGRAITHATYLKNRSPSTRLNSLSPLQFRTGEPQDFSRLRVFGCPAQIFIRPTIRDNNKLSDRSEKGTLIGMSKHGNGYIFRIQRSKEIVELDSKDVKFNETFSDCIDRQGKMIKGGRILNPDLMETTKTHQQNEIEEQPDNENEHRIPDEESESDNEPEEIYVNDKPDNDEVKDSNSDSSSSSSEEDDQEKRNKVNFSMRKIEPKKTSEPIKISTSLKKTSRAVKLIQSSEGFSKAPQNTSSKKNFENPDQSETRKSKREPKTRQMYEANFKPTYARKDSTFFTEEEDDNLEDLTPTETTFDQLLSCLEQQLKDESGKLKDDDEDLILKALQKGNPDPKSQKEINNLSKEEQKRYNDATKAEYEGMKSKEVMEFVRFTDIPKECKVYICIVNWLTKYVLGVYSKTKCRICFGGHHYTKTFTDCFAPTVNFCSVLIVLCLAAMFGWHLGSLDYSQAYLNAEIDEECYLRAPEFLREYDKDGVEFVWRLKKVIYGHPKGSRLWAECLDKNLKHLGFKQFQTDQCVYCKWINWDLQNLTEESYFILVLVHSDDLIVISNSKAKMLLEKESLLYLFDGIDQGMLKSFCGVEIDISDNKISLGMNYYWKKVMKKFGIKSEETTDKPLKAKVNRSDCPKVPNAKTKQTYLQVIGSIIFGFTHCRLDLAFPVGVLTRVMHAPSEKHLRQLMDLLRYINGTISWGLNYYRDSTIKYGMLFTFFGFCDSSHADDIDTFRSTGGYFFFLRKGQGCVCSKSGQTPDVALSSSEAETIWACSASQQGAFIKQFIDEIKIFSEVKFELHEDSQPAINAQKKNVSQSRFRHIKLNGTTSGN